MNEQPTAMHAPDLPELSAYLDGELDAGERQRVAAHLSACATCATHLADLQALSAGLKALPEDKLGFDLAGIIEGRLASATHPPAARRRRDWWLGLPVAVGAAASIAAGVFMGAALVAGGAATAPRMAALRVFDAMPPGNLCIGLESCYVKERVK
ncbi:MAG: zf-HC2 domain-containing protein [Gammaproteobacteria bacterium]|nr:zf-HC2 domain-containing protein [Rhodocyclaceae bacterium]MBU3910749.1 zf-HC2 domain-containing protein [Gammaproteobacteria bacterium]MBU3988914.1 zf-HC2 domain-containing protein [Gammaproteobacteria bacterium]MBU4003459.1 zf-HC2 domain-containing protein [Gammaproteobacteria bacterium]MBU4021930.1 zf-HC2 domain-containing protein [Gammaproteobacteria bacterium]